MKAATVKTAAEHAHATDRCAHEIIAILTAFPSACGG
jgi:hypothetical protein